MPKLNSWPRDGRLNKSLGTRNYWEPKRLDVWILPIVWTAIVDPLAMCMREKCDNGVDVINVDSGVMWLQHA